MTRLPLIGFSTVVTLMLCAVGPANSQPHELKFRHLTVREGLSQSAVHTIAQDRQGCLWFGTQDGLNRYDGYSFRIYRHNPADSTTISDNYVWKVLLSHNGDLWIGTYHGGLNRFDHMRGRFVRHQLDPASPGDPGLRNVVALHEDTSTQLWV
ncbi:MAG: two-component regulator propeller domain-containing protein, partial [Bacteroidota bacterium]